jgi:UDP-N-acetylglucosamine 2-epimerase (non-hydrolysing)
VLVEGDTNSGLGAAIAATKLRIPVGHVEAGCRSFDKFMPEEINRVLISDVADLNFAATENCMRNLLGEGIPSSRLFLTGHPIVDLMHEIRNKIPNNNSLDGFAFQEKAYALVTVHRRENVTNKITITNLLNALDNLSHAIPLIFPCHPHTRRQIQKFGLENYLTNVKVIEPVGFLQSLGLIKHARFVLTDSGGINFLAGQKREVILEKVQYLEKYYDDVMQRFKVARNLFGGLGVSKGILKIMEERIDSN